ASGIAHGDLGRGPAAERMADEMDIRQIQLFDEVEIKIGEIADAHHPFGDLRAAEARMLGREDAMLFGEKLQERAPIRAAGAVQEEHGLPLPRFEYVQFRAVYLATCRFHMLPPTARDDRKRGHCTQARDRPIVRPDGGVSCIKSPFRRPSSSASSRAAARSMYSTSSIRHAPR